MFVPSASLMRHPLQTVCQTRKWVLHFPHHFHRGFPCHFMIWRRHQAYWKSGASAYRLFGIHRKLILETRNMGFLCNGKTFNETITHNNLGGRKYTYWNLSRVNWTEQKKLKNKCVLGTTGCIWQAIIKTSGAQRAMLNL